MASRSPDDTGHGLRAGLRDQAAETPLAPVIFLDRAFKRCAVEVGPIGRNEHELAVGGLPQQEIRQPLLAAGADDQVGIGQVRRIEMLPERSAVIAAGSRVPSLTMRRRCGAPPARFRRGRRS